jgi:hypothetical protein
MENSCCVVTFEITQHSLIFEKKLRDNGFEVKLMPVPRELSSSCGIAAYINCDDKANILSLCEDENVIFEKFHEVNLNKSKSWFFKHLKK